MIILLLLAACAGPEKTTCDELCTHMVQDCEFDAYPTYDSCLQGCAYSESQGADVEGENTCIQKAGCDEFGILECEHKFGAAQ